MIEAIGENKKEQAAAVAEKPVMPSSKVITANQTADESQKSGTTQSAYSLKVSQEAKDRQMVLTKCRSDYQSKVRDLVKAGGDAIESHAVAYRKIRDKIAAECPEALRKDAVDALDREFEKGVAEIAEELGNSFGQFFNYTNHQNRDYRLPMNDQATFSAADFRKNVINMAHRAKEAAMKSKMTDTESLEKMVRKSLGNRIQSAKLENMSLGDIRTLDTVLRNLPSLTPTDNLQQIGQRCAMWEIIGDHLRDGEGLSRSVKEKTLAVLANNLNLYQQIGKAKNIAMLPDQAQSVIDAAEKQEKIKFQLREKTNPLLELKEKLWVVETQWKTAAV